MGNRILPEEIANKINTIISEELRIPLSGIDPEKNFKTEMHFDSLQLVNVTARVETEFGIELPASIIYVNTLNDFLELVKGELDKKGG